MKVAYWPGCVSRGFTPELHGSVAKVAPMLDLELVELDRANCCGAGVIAEHNQELADTLNARTFAMAQAVDGALGHDEHLLDLPGRAVGVPGAPRRRRPTTATHVNTHLKPEGLALRALGRLVEQELPLAAGRGDRPRQAARARRAPARGPADRAVLRLLHRAPDQAPRLRRPPRARPLPGAVIEALGGTPVDYAGKHKCCGFPVITMNRTTSLRQAGRHVADAIDADADCMVTPVPALPPEPRPAAARRGEVRGARPRPAGAALPADDRAGAGPRAEGARDEQARRRRPATCSARSRSWPRLSP